MALVDGDAYGLDILSVYKYGSAGMRHENAKLAAGRIEWIGLWASELAECVSRVSLGFTAYKHGPAAWILIQMC